MQAQGKCSDHQTTITSIGSTPTQHCNNSCYRNQELHQPHDYPFPLSGLSLFSEGPNTGIKEHADLHAASGIMPGGQGPSQEGRTVDLTSRSVQMEIIQMRDELKRFHDLMQAAP